MTACSDLAKDETLNHDDTAAPAEIGGSSTSSVTKRKIGTLGTSSTPILADSREVDDDKLHHNRYFTLRYHIKLILRQASTLVSFLVHGTPIWLFKLIRLLAFVFALFPAFLVFAFYYATCDRVSVPYKEGPGATSRHFLDVYGSNTESPTRIRRIDSDVKSTPKPVVIFLTGGAWIIGYKMWGAFLARALAPFGVLVCMPDYRNFPQVTVGDMINDVDESIQWVIDNCREFNGDPDRVVLVGQSAGAHLGSCVLLMKALSELRGSKVPSALSTKYKASVIKGFISASGPYNLVSMQEIFHQHGLDRGITARMFGNKLESYSPAHLLADCQQSLESNKGDDGALGRILPPICVVHGTSDKTVPYEGAIDYASCLRDAKVRVTTQMYPDWSHTDPILEAPMSGDHTFHRDVYDLVKEWTVQQSGAGCSKAAQMMVPFDESMPACRRICPSLLISMGRFFNPF